MAGTAGLRREILCGDPGAGVVVLENLVLAVAVRADRGVEVAGGKGLAMNA